MALASVELPLLSCIPARIHRRFERVRWEHTFTTRADRFGDARQTGVFAYRA